MKILMHDYCNSSFQLIEGFKTSRTMNGVIFEIMYLGINKRFIAAEKLIEDKVLAMINRCNINKF